MKISLQIKWIASLAAVVIMTVAMQKQGAALKTAYATKGIVSLEFGSTINSVKTMLAHWQVETVRTNILLDFLYIPAYAFFFFMSLHLLLNMHQGKLRKRGTWLKNMVFVAAGCDFIENILMLNTIAGHFSEVLIMSTTIMAAIKFILLIQIVFYLMLSLLVIFIKKVQEKSMNVTQ